MRVSSRAALARPYGEPMSDMEWGPDDEAQAAVAGYGPDEPFFTVQAFVSGLHDDSTPSEVLRSAVTPESVEAWGDFSGVREYLKSLGDWGVGSYPAPAAGAPDVAYVKVLRDVPQTYRQTTDEMLLVPAVLTLVWRPEVGFWLVHSIGEPADPSVLTRTSPGVAPSYTRAN